MAKLRQIAQLGHEVLRQQAEPVHNFDDQKIIDVIDDMLMTLSESNGVGIAAPQIYESYQIVIIASRPTPRYPDAPLMEPTLMINPEFQALSPDREKDWEGCLSIPGIRALVPRYSQIRVSYSDRQGQLQEQDLSGFVARVFQHEYDHLEGKVYLDRVENNGDIISEQEFQKLISKP